MNAAPIKLAPPTRGLALTRQDGEAAARTCNCCERLMTICSFSLKTRVPVLRRQSYCRECQAAASRRSYERNHAKVVSRSRENTKRMIENHRTWLWDLLATEKCVDCGICAPEIFEFDHRHDAKRDSVSRMISQRLSVKTITAEIAKCDILCPNCHRLRTHADQDSYVHRYMLGLSIGNMDDPNYRARARMRNRLDNLAYLEDHPCVDCGEDDLRLLEHDHVRGTKAEDVSKLISSGASLERIARERALCDTRCVNCHRRKSDNARQGELQAA